MSNPFRIDEDEIREAINGMPEDQRGPWEQVLAGREKARRLLAEGVENGDWRQALNIAGSEGRARVFADIEDRLTDDDVRDLLDSYWSITEAWSGDPELREVMYRLLQRVAPLHVIDDGQPLPDDETLTIYRGNLGEKPGEHIASWTLDRQVAEQFALMANSPRGMYLGMYRENGVPSIWRARVAREHVIGYFDDRQEREVVVDGKHLIGVTLIACAE
jgi:hypothetical protein